MSHSTIGVRFDSDIPELAIQRAYQLLDHAVSEIKDKPKEMYVLFIAAMPTHGTPSQVAQAIKHIALYDPDYYNDILVAKTEKNGKDNYLHVRVP